MPKCVPQYPEDRELLSRKAKKAAKEIAEKQNAGKEKAREVVDTADVIVPSRTKHSMGGVALQLLAKKAELRRRMEETRRRLNEEAEAEAARSQARKVAIREMRGRERKKNVREEEEKAEK